MANTVRHRNRTHKKCKVCKEIKPVSEFYKKDTSHFGIQYYHSMCKPCEKRYRAKMQDWYKGYIKEWNKENKEYITAKHKEITKSQPKRNRTRNRTRYYISIGKIIKMPCAVCGAIKVHAHHPDYDDHMRVVWLCPQHHSLLHAGDYVLENDVPVMIFDRFNAV